MSCRRPVCAGVVLVALAASSAPAQQEPGLSFREVAAALGLDFRHHHGGSGRRYMVETVVGGVVLFDYDLDGDLDAFFVDGGPLPGYRGERPRSRLLRNDGRQFSDVTERSGITFSGYGSGGAAGDVDGDGDLDLYLTAFGENALFRNLGDGRFEADPAAGVGDPLWSTSATFFDADRDGDLDLYVANYVDFSVENHKFCGDARTGVRSYCHPDSYEGLPDHFYRNDGAGRFRDDSDAAGFGSAVDAGLGVIAGDLNDDGWPDLYVANDLDPNLLFLNRGDGTFVDESLLSGTSHSHLGRSEAGMGVEMSDLDGDGELDLFVTNFENETNAFYRNTGGGTFLDQRFVSNLAEPSMRHLAFGVAAADFDQDGDLDVFIANGHTLDNARELDSRSEYAQANQVMENLGRGRFRERLDVGVDLVRVSRGLATGDLDGDLDLDVVIVSSNDVAEVYENVGGAGTRSLIVDLAGGDSNRFGVGSRLRLQVGDSVQVREVRTASSFLSQGQLGAHFGVGNAGSVELSVRWPSGRRLRLRSLLPGRRYRIAEPGISARRGPGRDWPERSSR